MPGRVPNLSRTASCLFFLLACFPSSAFGQETITLTPAQIVESAAELIRENKLADAKTLLTKTPFQILELEIERLYLLGRVALAEKRYDEAIKLYRFILDHQPNLAKIRLELALAYMAEGSWYRADYHMRLAAAADLPPEVMRDVRRYLYAIRQNKNWNLWFNAGLASDDNAGAAAGGEECVTYSSTYGQFPYPLCRKLAEPEKAVGYSLGFGGSYEFKFGERWRLKNDFAALTSLYDKPEYDVTYLGASSGPRYVFPNGDVWLAATGYQMWYGGESYRYSAGAKIDTNYDFTPKLSGNLLLHYNPTFYYGDAAEYLDGDARGGSIRLAYAFDSSKYAVLKAGLEKENTKESGYANLRKSLAVGFGMEVPFGFRLYVEPSIERAGYDAARYTVVETVNGSEYRPVVEKDFTKRFFVSVSNNKIDLFGFTPVIGYAYTDKDSNISARAYKKGGFTFSLQRRF